MYQPTLFLPIDVAERINAIITPIERAFYALDQQPNVTSTTKQVIDHNLNKLKEFKQQQDTILQTYSASKLSSI